MSDIRITFVLPTEATDASDTSETMIQAYESCKQLVDNISWAKESELSNKKFDKLDYVVFESFEGKDFSKLIESKSAVLGPMAVSVCLMEGKPIPSFQWPILNVAMYDCQVTCSQISKSAKEAIKDKVQLMGGLYTGNFTGSITHLICNGTNSEKYMLAAERGVKLMLPDWIDHIFEASKVSNINANDPQILKKYKCLPFHNLTICTTGITKSKEKAKLSEAISANGGKMVAKLNFSEADVLVCHGVEGTTSEKYKAARRSRLSCVTLNWIYDSIQNGYALPQEKYYVKTVTSTPTKEGENIDPNFSTISCIGTLTNQRSTINETVNTTQISTTATVSGSTTASNKRKASDDLVEKIDIKKVKKAGQFLDGCSIFVVGFSPEHRDKLNKIVNLSGATRYDDFSERVTHIIVGDPTCYDVTVLKVKRICCALVSVEWLLDSVEQHGPAKEDKYLIHYKDLNEAKKSKMESPLSKKALSLLKSSNITTANKDDKVKLQEPAVEHDDALTQHYLKNATSEKEEEDTLAILLKNQEGTTSKKDSLTEEFNIRTRLLHQKSSVANPEKNQSLEFKPHETSTQVSQVTSDISDDTDVIPIFSFHTFFLDGFNEEDADAYQKYITGVGGTVVDKHFKGVVDYAVVPIFNQPENLPPAQEIVNDLWIIQSIEEECACNIKYFHRPMSMPSSMPLKDCVVTSSVYTGQERLFLKYVIEGLGGIFQEQFSRKNVPAKNVLASTHLVSPEASGKKYEAALKWNLPVVNKDWLLECAKSGTKVDVKQYLLSNNTNRDNTLVNNDSKKSNVSSNDSAHQRDIASRSTSFKKNDKPCNKTDEEKDLHIASNHVFTPECRKSSKDDTMNTPKHQIYNLNNKNTPDASSQVTPVNTVLQRFNAINGPILPTPSPKTYYPWDPKTPDTPIGAFIRDNPSPRLRKEMQKYVNSFPDFVPPKKRRCSTPLSELKRRLRNKVLGIGEYSQNTQDDAGPSTQEPCQDSNDKPKTARKESADINFEKNEESSVNVVVHQKLQELQQMVMANGSTSATRRSSRMFEASTNPPGIITTNNEVQSQVCTVGWDYGETDTETLPQKLFLLSGIEASQREHLSKELKNLGGVVLESSTYEATCTHLICPKPAKNEKSLACMAAGKWILHFSYVEKCVQAEKFLDEEEFEFGNPKARQNISYEEKDTSIYYWRKEVKRRGYGAFNDMRAIVVAEKKEPITNVIEAGGGVVINVMPPFNDSIHATHCLLEMKMVKDISKYVPLAQQGIKCVNTIYINDFLWRNKKDDSDYIIPYFAKYY